MNQTALIRFNECINYEYEVNVNNVNKNVSCDCYADTFLSSMWRAAPNVTFRARTLTFLACLGRNKSFLTLRPWRSLPLTTAIILLCGKLILKFVQSSVSYEKFRADLPCDPPWLTVARVMVRKVNSAEWRHGRRSGGGSWCVVAASSMPTTHKVTGGGGGGGGGGGWKLMRLWRHALCLSLLSTTAPGSSTQDYRAWCSNDYSVGMDQQ